MPTPAFTSPPTKMQLKLHILIKYLFLNKNQMLSNCNRNLYLKINRSYPFEITDTVQIFSANCTPFTFTESQSVKIISELLKSLNSVSLHMIFELKIMNQNEPQRPFHQLILLHQQGLIRSEIHAIW